MSRAKDLPDYGLIATRLAVLLPGTRQVELPWAGQLPTLERPQELPGILTAFLREIVPAWQAAKASSSVQRPRRPAVVIRRFGRAAAS